MTSARAALVLGAFALAACVGRGGDVHGSLAEVYDVRFDVVRARLYATELAIEYAREDGAVPVRVSIARAALDEGLREIAIGAGADVGGTTREGSTMPRAERGDVRLDRFDPRAREPRVRGRFAARFPTSTAVLELDGDFDLPLEIVDWNEARGPVPVADGGLDVQGDGGL